MSIVSIKSDQSRWVNWTVRKQTDVTLTINVTQNSVAADISGNTYIAEFFKIESPLGSPFLTLTQGAGITNGGATGVLTIALNDTQLNLDPNEYFWKLRTTAPTDYLWFNGIFKVNGYTWDGGADYTVNVALTVANNEINLELIAATVEAGTVQTLSNGLRLDGTVGKLGDTLTENTTIEGAGLYGLTLGHLTDATKYLSYLYGVVPNTGDIYWAVKNAGTGGETSLYLKGAGSNRALLQSDNGIILLAVGGGIASNAATTQQIIAGTTMMLQAATSITSTGSKHSFTPAATYAGLNVGSLAGNPSSLANGDIWYNSSSNELNARINGATVALGAGSGAVTWGSITGTLSNQTDLQTALDAKWTKPSLTTGSVLFWGATDVTENNTKLFWSNTTETLFIGANSTTFTGVKINSIGTVASYMQNNIQNLSANAAASGDWIVTADNGTDSTLYGDFGMNSSGWSGTGVLDAANTVYLYAKNAPLSIGTDGSTDFILFSGGTASSNERIRIKSTGTVLFTSPVTTGTGATAGIQGVFNSLTSGNGVDLGSSSGAAGTLLKAAITGTEALTNSKAIYGLQSGANANVSQQTAAIYGQNIRTGGGINIGVFGYASGGTTNWAGYFGPGDVKFEANINGGSAFNYTPSGTLDVAFGSSSIPSRFLFGQSTSSYGGLVWNYNATPASAYLSIGAGNTGSSPTFILPTLNFYQTGNVQFNLLTTTGTGSAAGAQFLGNSLTTGNLIDVSNGATLTNLSTGSLAKFTSTSTAINYTSGTNALVGVFMSGANTNSSRTAVGFSSLITNTGTSSTNTAIVARSSGATVNNSLDLVGAILLTGSAGTSGQVLTSAGAGATPTWSDHMTPSAINSVSPTSPNRTVTIVYNGTTLYLHAKTSND